jgi:hypothetical protein
MPARVPIRKKNTLKEKTPSPETTEKPEQEAAPNQPPIELESPSQDSPAQNHNLVQKEAPHPFETKSRRLFFAGIVISAFVLGATIATLYFKISEEGTDSLAAGDTLSGATAEPEPTPTPLPRSEITLEILNGSDVAGLAAKTKANFEKLGYPVSRIGNAEENVEVNQLYLDQDIDKESLQYLLEDAQSELKISEVSGTKDIETTAQIVLSSN